LLRFGADDMLMRNLHAPRGVFISKRRVSISARPVRLIDVGREFVEW